MSSSRRQFRIINKLADGGFGSVFLAEMLSGDGFSRVVAVKLLHEKWSEHEEIARRARDEARLLGRLRHRNIVRVLDLTSLGGQCAVIMEYIEGVDLKVLLEWLTSQGKALPARACFEIVTEVADGNGTEFCFR